MSNSYLMFWQNTLTPSFIRPDTHATEIVLWQGEQIVWLLNFNAPCQMDIVPTDLELDALLVWFQERGYKIVDCPAPLSLIYGYVAREKSRL